MKRLSVVASAIALLAVTGTAMADTTTVAVAATVTGTCRFTGTGSVDFTLDPATGGLANGTVVQPTFWCTKGKTYTIGDDYGANAAGVQRRLKLAGLAEYIPYSFTYNAAGTGAGKTPAASMNIASTILETDYVNASAGSYADQITLTITP